MELRVDGEVEEEEVVYCVYCGDFNCDRDNRRVGGVFINEGEDRK